MIADDVLPLVGGFCTKALSVSSIVVTYRDGEKMPQINLSKLIRNMSFQIGQLLQNVSLGS